MTNRQIETSREIRLWIRDIIVPSIGVGATVFYLSPFLNLFLNLFLTSSILDLILSFISGCNHNTVAPTPIDGTIISNLRLMKLRISLRISLRREISKMLHERWNDYTEEEIRKIDNERCKNCKYKSFLFGNEILFCNYLGITGKRRETRPEDCNHYLEE